MMTAITIIGVTLCLLIYTLFNIFKVPKSLRGTHRILLIPYFLSVLKGQSFEFRFKKFIKPALLKHKRVLLWTQGRWKLVIADSKVAQEILTKSSHFVKRDIKDLTNIKRLTTNMLGTSNILLTDNDQWRRHRRIANPAFKKSWDTALFDDIVIDSNQKIIDSKGQEMDVNTFFQNITLDALGKGIFGYNFNAVKNAENNDNLVLYHKLFKAIANPVYAMFPSLEAVIPSRARSFEQCKEFREFLLGIVEERRQEIKDNKAGDDLLTRIIEASHKEDNPLSDEEVINNLAIFFLAGHDTTANTLSSIVFFLAKHPEIQEKARKEVMEVMDNPTKMTIPTIEQTKSLDYLNAIIKETMRVVTTVGLINRYCPKAVALSDGTHIPDDTFVLIDNWAIHHDEKMYPEPEAFKPERFSEAHSPQEQQWMPFGHGSRMCIGMSFSLLEQRVVLATMLQKYRFTMTDKAAKTKHEVSRGGLLKIENNFIKFQPL